MLGPSLRSKKKREYPPPTRGHKKTPSLIPLIQGRLPHDSPWFCVSVIKLLYFETSSHVKLRYKMSYKYVILGGGGGGGGGGVGVGEGMQSNLVP